MNTIAELLDRQAQRHASRPFLIDPATGAVTTYAETAALAERAARLLEGRGIRPGDRVALALPNHADLFHCLFAAAKLRAAAVLLAPDMKTAELVPILQDSEPRMLFLERGSEPLAAALRERLPDLRIEMLSEFLREPVAPKAPARDAHGGPASASPRDPFLIFYTSGTTAAPKGVVHTQGSALAILKRIQAHFRFRTGRRALCLLPLNGTYGLLTNCLSSFFCGGSLVLCPASASRTLPSLWETVRRFDVQTLCLTPTIVSLLIEMEGHFGPLKKTPLRFALCSTGRLLPEPAQAFERIYGMPLVNVYGSVEMGSVAAQTPLRKGLHDGAVGRPLGCAIRIVGREGSSDVGEVFVSGDGLMLGYHGRPDMTGKALRDGGYYSGDLGRIDPEGALHVFGRIGNMIKRAGRSVVPEDVDAALQRHPLVMESMTKGEPDKIYGEKVVSCVVLKPGAAAQADELIRHCRALLSDHKCPDSVRFVESIPKGPGGKVKR